jgi:hypothetical protein
MLIFLAVQIKLIVVTKIVLLLKLGSRIDA